MRDIINDTLRKLQLVEHANEWDQHKIQEKKTRTSKMETFLLEHAGLNHSMISRTQSSDLYKTDIDEDENRSDAEIALFFRNRELAELVMELGLELGIPEGVINFDPTVDPKYDVGEYAIRIEPSLHVSDPQLFYFFLEAMRELIDVHELDEFDKVLESYEDLMEVRFQQKVKTDKKYTKGRHKGKNVQKTVTIIEPGNEFHDARGRFTSKAKAQRKGSKSHLALGAKFGS